MTYWALRCIVVQCLTTGGTTTYRAIRQQSRTTFYLYLTCAHAVPWRTCATCHIQNLIRKMQWTNQNWTPLGMNLLQNNLSKDVWWGRHVCPKNMYVQYTLASATMYVAASCRNPGKRLTKSSCAAVKFLCVTRTGTRHSYNFWENLVRT